jgi:hypothetical protein
VSRRGGDDGGAWTSGRLDCSDTLSGLIKLDDLRGPELSARDWTGLQETGTLVICIKLSRTPAIEESDIGIERGRMLHTDLQDGAYIGYTIPGILALHCSRARRRRVRRGETGVVADLGKTYAVRCAAVKL